MSAVPHPEPGLSCSPQPSDWGIQGVGRARDGLPPTGGEWNTSLEKEIHRMVLQLHNTQAAQRRQDREAGLAVEGRVPIDPLAHDWFSPDKDTVESRVFLLERVLPALVPGVQKLLEEAERRGELEEEGGEAGEAESRQSFNPLNYLGQCLLRSPPRSGPGTPTVQHSYSRGLQMARQDLERSGVDAQNSRLAEMKQRVRARRSELQREERTQDRGEGRRRECLRLQFSEWSLGPDGTLPLSVVQNALRSFLELSSTEGFCAETEAWSDRVLGDMEQPHTALLEDDYAEYVLSVVAGVSWEQFSGLLQHLSLCSEEQRRRLACQRWREVFSQLFTDCDCAETGLLDRHRVLVLLENFYDSQCESTQRALYNPRCWPVREAEDLNPDLWDDCRTQERPEEEERAGEPVQSNATISAAVAGQMNSKADNEEDEGGEREMVGSVGGGEEAPSEERDPSGQRHADTPREGGEQKEGESGSDTESEPEELILVMETGPAVEELDNWGPARGVSAFDRSTLDRAQFIQQLETFLGEGACDSTVHSLAGYLRGGYRETEQERLARLQQARREVVQARRGQAIDELFEKWDNEGRGFLDKGEVEGLLDRYKEGTERAALQRAWQQGSPPLHSAACLSRGQFRQLLEAVVHELPPEGVLEGGFQGLLAFLEESVAHSLAERTRGAARRKWLAQVQMAAESGGASLEPVYRAVFQSLYKDAETYGNEKMISASVALLEGGERLRYVACTAEDAPYVLNQELQRRAAPVSFAAMDDGKPVHVPRVRLHGGLHFFNTDRPEPERRGSFIAVPLKDPRGRPFGVLGIDTLRDPQERNIFLRHEIDFYQGVCSAFSQAFQHILTRRNILRIVESATYWLHSRVPGVRSLTTYLMESTGEKGSDYTLRKMMVMDNRTGRSRLLSTAPALRRSDHLFRDYLFRCADSSEPLRCVAYGERRLVVPLREPSGRALGVLDISSGPQAQLQPHEQNDLQGMVRMVQAACCQLLRESSGLAGPSRMLEAEGAGGEQRVGLLFLRFMLQDLRNCVRRLDHQSFAELKSYKDPPPAVHHVLRAVLLMLYPQWAGSPEIDSWSQCRLKVNSDLIRKVTLFDPTASSVQVDSEELQRSVAAVPRGEVWKHGSVPTEHLYNWVSVCLSLLEQSGRMRRSQPPIGLQH
ncbi:EFCB5 protein, partial [Amia calva]|nr:EFCB5 protein [Amia calva]